MTVERLVPQVPSDDGGKEEPRHRRAVLGMFDLSPQCRETLPHGVRAGHGQLPVHGSGSKTSSPAPTGKRVTIDGNEEMNGDMVRRAVRGPAPSESETSWLVTEEGGMEMKVSVEEAKMLAELRALKKDKTDEEL